MFVSKGNPPPNILPTPYCHVRLFSADRLCLVRCAVACRHALKDMQHTVHNKLFIKYVEKLQYTHTHIKKQHFFFEIIVDLQQTFQCPNFSRAFL